MKGADLTTRKEGDAARVTPPYSEVLKHYPLTEGKGRSNHSPSAIDHKKGLEMTDFILPQHIDSTMRACFASCPQKFYNEFCLGLRPPVLSVDLHAGAVFASTLERFRQEVWDNNKPIDEAVAIAHGTFIREWGNFQSEKDTPKTPERMWAAFTDYVKVYDPRMDHVRPYAASGKATSEFSFAIPLEPSDGFPLHPVTREPFIYVGRADLIGEYKVRPCILDDKTGSRLESNWTEKWDMRAQFQGYCWAAQSSGIDCDTVIVRGVIITKQQIRQVEAIKIYPRWMITRWLEQLRRDMLRLVNCYTSQWWDYNLGDACTQYGSCAFMNLCTIQDNLRSNFRSNYKVRRWNPLEKNPVGETAPVAQPVFTGNETMPVSISAPATNATPSST